MQKYIAVCIEGLEEVCKQELQELGAVNIQKIANGRLLFEGKLSVVKRIIKENRGLARVYELLLIEKCEGKEDFTNICKNSIRKLKLQIKEPFAARTGEIDTGISSQEIREKIGEAIYERGYKVDLKNPNTIIYAEIKEGKFFFGIDLNEKEFWKRDYLIQRHNQTVNPALAYCMCRLAGDLKTVIDPFCKDGVIPIECAFSGKKVYASDAVFFNIKKARINARLAKIEKKIKFTHCGIDWLDTKFRKGMFDAVITSPPFYSKNVDVEIIDKLYREFFNQIKFVLKKDGRIVVLLPVLKVNVFKKNCPFRLEKKLYLPKLKQEVLIYKK
ncbi:methyltransferase [archaeon]|nr:methyltransferase [archaeon]